jgi:hypothetical protein
VQQRWIKCSLQAASRAAISLSITKTAQNDPSSSELHHRRHARTSLSTPSAGIHRPSPPGSRESTISRRCTRSSSARPLSTGHAQTLVFVGPKPDPGRTVAKQKRTQCGYVKALSPMATARPLLPRPSTFLIEKTAPEENTVRRGRQHISPAAATQKQPMLQVAFRGFNEDAALSSAPERSFEHLPWSSID